MRPKIVVFTLLLGAGALILIGLLSGRLNQPAPENPLTAAASNSVAGTNPPPITQPEVTLPPPAVQTKETNVIATTPAEDLVARKEKDLDAIRDAVVSGSDDPGATLQAIASRLENENDEVRAAAREAAVQVDDTNMIPYLTSASDHLKDPHEKVALLEAIVYLQLPSSISTNSEDAVLRTNVNTKKYKKLTK